MTAEEILGLGEFKAPPGSVDGQPVIPPRPVPKPAPVVKPDAQIIREKEIEELMPRVAELRLAADEAFRGIEAERLAEEDERRAAMYGYGRAEEFSPYPKRSVAMTEFSRLKTELEEKEARLNHLTSEDTIAKEFAQDKIDTMYAGLPAGERIANRVWDSVYETGGSAARAAVQTGTDLLDTGKVGADVLGLGLEEQFSSWLDVDPRVRPTEPDPNSPVAKWLEDRSTAVKETMNDAVPELVWKKGGWEQTTGNLGGQFASLALSGPAGAMNRGIGKKAIQELLERSNQAGGMMLRKEALDQLEKEAAQQGSVVVAKTLTGAQAFNDKFTEARDAGVTDEDALKAGALNVATDWVEVNPLSRKLDRIETGSKVGDALLQTGKGGMEGGAGTLGSNLVTLNYINPEFAVTEGLGEGALVGAGMAGLSSGGRGREPVVIAGESPRTYVRGYEEGRGYENANGYEEHGIPPERALELSESFLNPEQLTSRYPQVTDEDKLVWSQGRADLLGQTYEMLNSGAPNYDALRQDLLRAHWGTLPASEKAELRAEYERQTGGVDEAPAIGEWFVGALSDSGPKAGVLGRAAADFQEAVQQSSEWIHRTFDTPEPLDFLDYLDGKQGREDGRLQQWRAESARSAAAVVQTMDPIFRESVVVVESAEAIPDPALRQRVLDENAKRSGRVEGFFNPADRKTYILADSAKNVAETVRHEKFHEVVDGNAEFDALLGSIARSIPPATRAELESKYAGGNERKLATEYLAKLAQDDPQSDVWQRFVYEFKRLMARALGDRVKFGEEELRQFVIKANSRVRAESVPGPGGGDLWFAKRDIPPIEREVIRMEGKIGGRGATHYGRFSGKRVTAEMLQADPSLTIGDELLEALEAAYPGIVVPFSKAARPKFDEVRYRGRSIVEAKYVKPEGFVASRADIRDGWRWYEEKLAKKIGMIAAARKIEQLQATHVWHHEWDGETLYLIPKSVHDVFKHTGGDGLRRAEMFRRFVPARLRRLQGLN